MKAIMLFTCIFIIGCTTATPIPVVDVPAAIQVAPAPSCRKAACPPLPALREGATRYEGRLHWLTVIALYKQCAESQE